MTTEEKIPTIVEPAPDTTPPLPPTLNADEYVLMILDEEAFES